MKSNLAEKRDYVSSTNACKACMSLGACIAFKGIEGCVPFLHGSQGCATYMRRYLISHFREPVDIASSSLGENDAVFGGGPNLKQGLVNMINKYQAKAVGIATTCLTETIGDNVPAIVREFLKEAKVEGADGKMPALIQASTPSYAATHMEGFHAAVKATVAQLAKPVARHGGVNILPGFVSPADIRYLLEVAKDFGLSATLLPDYSRPLDAPASTSYEILPSGGTPLADIKKMGGAAATLSFGWTPDSQGAGRDLQERCGVCLHSLGLPIGLRRSDAMFEALETVSKRPVPARHADERGRLLDAMVDGHKYLSGQRAVVYGEQDMVIGLASFLAEVGVQPVLCVSGGRSAGFRENIEKVTEGLVREPVMAEAGVDFYRIAELSRELKPDFMVGNSKGYVVARELDIPLVRVGFPIHDRFGGPRLHHLGYRGAQELYDRVVNALIEKKQNDSSVGYGYI
ncbi:MAG: nitrogenase [Desulfarculaceae bacterium]|nr:nitrogenase [Desulfarculaceae bacterium]MCF8049416.1 nitrogenase [Desulfarculaceae bacterium]MCF8065462.1 nitrogenase [Desulfarculaceae bacterium]MCF8099454.1 nitrogenase [Desulfarculaceae bacterium]MCF8121740.1 nitrogenase [Desulfarculaceae bacterium]